MKPTRPLIFAAALLAACLGACSRQEPDAPPVDNAVEAIDTPTPAPSPTPMPTPRVTPIADNASEASTEAEPAMPPDQQMLDDASATGMTARASRDEPSAEDTPAPVDVEQK